LAIHIHIYLQFVDLS